MSALPAQGGRQKRQHKRGYKSCRIRYGLEIPEHQAYARRLSERGLFIATNLVVFPVGSRLVMDLDMGGTIHRAAGLVRNAVKIDARYARLTKPGMGVEFTEITSELKKAIAAGA